MSGTVRSLLLGVEWYTDNPGGLHRYLADLMGALSGAGATARGVVLGPAAGAPVGVLAAGRVDQPLPWRLWSYTRAAHRAGADADVVDAHFALLALCPVVLGRLRRLPLVVHFQGPWAQESISDGRRGGWVTVARRVVERAVYRRAGEIVVLSGAFKRAIVEGYGVPPWRVTVLPPGVDLVRFSPGDRTTARASLGLAAEGAVVVAVRRQVPRTGLHVLLAAWQQVQHSQSGAVLLMVGDGPERASLEALADELGVAASVRFLGVVDEETVVACYRSADVAVVPSVALEGFGLVVLEALACGTPVVSTDVGGLPEALAPLDPTLVVPAGDAGALAERLQRVLADERGSPGRQRCRSYAEGFSWESVARRHQDLYARAVCPTRPKMRVVYLDHCARLSGGELALSRLLPALEHVDAHVILAEDGPLVGRLTGSGVSVEVLPMAESARGLSRHRVGPAHLPIRSAVDSALHVVRLAHRLRRLRPDLVHTNSLKAALYGGLAGRMVGIPVIWHVRDRIAEGYLPTAGRVLVNAMARRLPAALIANSQATLDTVGRGRTPATVVYSPVDVHASTLVERAPVPGSSPLRVGMVGRLAPWKGQHVFLEAFARAFPGGEAEAIVVGGPLFGEEGYQAELVRRAAALGIAERVSFRGHCPDVHRELSNLDVLVHASVLPEPFGLVVVEGMAAGLAVVAAGAGGPAEVVTDGVDGILCPPGDVERLAGELRRLAADPELRQRLGTAARLRAAAFAPPVIAPQVEVVYRSVLAAAGHASDHRAAAPDTTQEDRASGTGTCR